MSSNIDATQQGGGVVGGVGWMLTFLARCTNIDATQQGGGVVGGVGWMLTFLARCTNIDATQQGGGVVGGVGGMLTFLARCTNIDPRTKKINPALWDWIYSWINPTTFYGNQKQPLKKVDLDKYIHHQCF